MRSPTIADERVVGRMHLTRYESRRDGSRVGAEQITQIRTCQFPNRGAELLLANGETVNLGGHWIGQHMPEVGGYYVVGEGSKHPGYYVTAKTFLENYAQSLPLPEPPR